jgi:tetratricopeptide (TPR) repeat protein
VENQVHSVKSELLYDSTVSPRASLSTATQQRHDLIQHTKRQSEKPSYEKTKKASAASIPPWRIPLTRKQTRIVEKLEAAVRNDDIVLTWMLMQKLIGENLLIRMKPATLASVFHLLHRNNSPVLEDYLLAIDEQSARFEKVSDYAAWVNYYRDIKRPWKAIQVYFHYRPVAMFDDGRPFLEAVFNTLYVKKNSDDVENTIISGNASAISAVFKDIIQHHRSILDDRLETFLLDVARDPSLTCILDMYREAIDAGLKLSIETEMEIFSNIFIDDKVDMETLLMLYLNIRAAGRKPSPLKISRMVNVILIRRTTNIVGKLSLEERLESALELIYELIADGVTPEPVILQLVLSKLKIAKKLEKAEEFYRLAIKENLGSLELDAGYVGALIRQDKVDEAQKYFLRMITKTFHQQPDGTYTGPNGEILFDHKLMYISWSMYKLYDYMVARLDDPSNEEMPSIGHILNTHPDNHSYIYRVMVYGSQTNFNAHPEFMNNVQYTPSNSISIYPISTAAEDLFLEYRRNDDIKNALELYKLLRSLRCVNYKTMYCMLAIACSKRDMKLCDTLVNDVFEFKIPITMLICRRLIDVFMLQRNVKKAERILHIHITTRKYMEQLERSSELYTADPYWLYIACEYTITGQLDDAKRVLDIYNKTKSEELEVSGGYLLGIYMNQHSSSRLKRVAKFIEEQGMELRIAHYTMLMDFYGKRQRLNEVLYWYKKACEIGEEADIFVITCLIQAYSYAQQNDKAIETYMMARKKYGYCINNTSLSVLCDVSGYYKCEDTLVNVWRDALADKVKPNENNYASLVEAYWRIGNIETATDILVRQMPEVGFPPNYHMLMTLISKTKKEQLRHLTRKLVASIKKWYHGKHQLITNEEWLNESIRKEEYKKSLQKYETQF